jgi:hypothetical protein
MLFEYTPDAPLTRRKVESTLDTEIEEYNRSYLYGGANEVISSLQKFEHGTQKECERCGEFAVTLRSVWHPDGLITSDSFSFADAKCSNCESYEKFTFDEKSEEYVEKAQT